MLGFFRLACLLFLIITSSCYAEMTLSVEGLSGALATNVEARIELIDTSNISNSAYFKNYLESEIRKSLKALGYYSPKFTYQLKNKNRKLQVNISPGLPVRIDEVNIHLTGFGKDDNDFNALIKHKTPKVGDILNHGVYESFKRDLQNLASSKGYFNAKMTKHQLAVSDKTNQAFWNIDFDTGERYKFGKITLLPAQIESAYLSSLLTFNEGEEYNANLITLLNWRLSSTNWFSSVVISPDFANVSDDKSLPIEISTTPRRKNSMDVGLGFSNDNGFSAKIGWNKPWINSFGHSFQSNLFTSKPEDLVTMSYKMPLEKSPLEDYYTVQSGLKRVNDNDTISNIFTLGIIRNWDSYHSWKSSVGMNYMHDTFEQGDVGYITQLYYPSVNLYKISSDGRLLIMNGFSQSYSLETASHYLASDIDFMRLQVQYNWIRSLGENHRFIARGNMSIIRTNDFNRLPPTLRFFAGGDRSIRGFNYQSISPKDSNGKLIGAPKLVTGSLEYQYNLFDEWWGALFIDSGEAVNQWDKSDLHTGVGFGVRWVSPIGSIKVDVATPRDKINIYSIHVYIGLGTEL